MAEFPELTRTAGIHELVERQIKQWEADKLKLLKESQKKKKKRLNTVITVSRQLGSLGEEISVILAEKLGYRLLSKEIMEFIAEKEENLKACVESIDEPGYTWMENTLTSIFTPRKRFPHQTFFKHLSEVVLVSARHGKVIMVGRGANLILKEPEIFRVRLIAPFEIRVQRIQDRLKISKSEAEKMLENSDKRRKLFIRSYFKVDIDDATLYDIVLNTEWLTPKEAASQLIWAFRIHKEKYDRM